jgi:GAF domain-containing protein
VVRRPPTLADDLPGELRRLQAALAVAVDRDQVARLAVQASRRSVGADAGAMVLIGDDGLGHLTHAEGYGRAVLDEFKTVSPASQWPIATTLRDGSAVFLEVEGMLEHPHETIRLAGKAIVGLACVPAWGAGRLHGALGISWSGPVDLAPVLQEHLVTMGALVGARLAELDPPG